MGGFAEIAKLKATKLCELYLDKAALFLMRFDSVWLQTSFFGIRSNRRIQWNLSHPKLGTFALLNQASLLAVACCFGRLSSKVGTPKIATYLKASSMGYVHF